MTRVRDVERSTRVARALATLSGTLGSVRVGQRAASRVGSVRRPRRVAQIGALALVLVLAPAGTALAATAPSVSSDSADAVSGTSATLHGTVDPGDSDLTDCHAEYVDDATFQATGYATASTTPCAEMPIAANAGPTSVSAAVSSLTQGTLYHFRFAATNATGTTTATEQTFTTAVPPIVGTEGVTAITSSYARASGSIDPQGWDTVWQWEYSADAGFLGSSFAPAGPVDMGSGVGDTSVGTDASTSPPTTKLTGLSTGTTYYYRLVATNAAGVVDGPTQSFTTAAAPSIPVATGITMTTATLTGVANPQGHSATYHFLYGLLNQTPSSTPETSVGFSDAQNHTVTAPVTGLLPGHDYTVSLVITPDNGTTVTGDAGSFKAAPGPNVMTGGASGIDTTSATLQGTLDSKGVTGQYTFSLSGDAPDSPLTDIPNPAGGTQSVSATFTGLQPGKTYTYNLRVVLANGVVGSGAPQRFTTAVVPPPPPPHRQPDSAAPYGCSSPHLDQPVPGRVRQGRQVTITGQDLGVAGQIAFGKQVIDPDSWTGTSFTFTVPGDTAPGAYSVLINCLNDSNAITLTIPDNEFRIWNETTRGKVAKLTLKLPGVGAVKVTGKYLKTKHATARKGGLLNLRIPLNRAGIRALKRVRGGILHVKATFTYTPPGGSPGSQTDNPAFDFVR